MSQFEQGNTVGIDTRFQPGTSGNPGGRPLGLGSLARDVLSEAADSGDMTKAEALVRRLYDLAMEGSVPALKLIMDREWPAVKQLDLSGSLEVENQHAEAGAELGRKVTQWQDGFAKADEAATTAMSAMNDAERLEFLQKRFDEERNQSLIHRLARADPAAGGLADS